MLVDNNTCLHCGACVGTCPGNSLFLHETSTIEFFSSCTQCGLCLRVCPVGAIDFDAGPGDRRAAGSDEDATHHPAGATV